MKAIRQILKFLFIAASMTALPIGIAWLFELHTLAFLVVWDFLILGALVDKHVRNATKPRTERHSTPEKIFPWWGM